MDQFGNIGRLLIGVGIVIALIGGVLLVVGRVPFLGRLPGDIRIQRGNLTCFVPIVTSLLLSLLLTIVVNVLLRWLRR